MLSAHLFCANIQSLAIHQQTHCRVSSYPLRHCATKLFCFCIYLCAPQPTVFLSFALAYMSRIGSFPLHIPGWSWRKANISQRLIDSLVFQRHGEGSADPIKWRTRKRNEIYFFSLFLSLSLSLSPLSHCPYLLIDCSIWLPQHAKVHLPPLHW